MSSPLLVSGVPQFKQVNIFVPPGCSMKIRPILHYQPRTQSHAPQRHLAHHVTSFDAPHPCTHSQPPFCRGAAQNPCMQSCNAIIARPVPFLAAEGCIVCHVCQLAMARIGGGPSNPPATDDNASNTGSDSEMDEEVLKLYQQRPPSLRVSDSGKKERDPEYHCLMEKVRCVTLL